jgi:tetratricopeptide (TPR) repeat protein
MRSDMQPPERLAHGYAAREAGDHATALAHFVDAAEAEPDFHPARIAAAETLVALGRPDEAEFLFRAVLEEAPNDLGALLGLSEIARLAQDLSGCLTLARQAMQAHPDAPAAVLQATRALLELDAPEEALATLRPFGAASGWPAVLRAREGEILRHAGRWQEARAALDAATGADLSLFVQRVLLHLTIHELDAAARLVDQPPARTRLARAYGHHLRGQVAEARWRLDEAARHYRAAIAEDHTLAWPHAELARVRLLQFDLEGCRHHRDAALQLDSAPHLRRRQRLRVTGTHLGQIWDEFRADTALGARVAACMALDPAMRAGALLDVLREEPDTLAPSLLLLIALRQSGQLDRARPAADAAIPRRIVQFWAGDLPDDVAALMDSWRQLHPGWEYCRFDLAGAGEWLSAHAAAEVLSAYVRARLAAQKADVFRLAYLQAAGGVWADADDRCIAPLDGLVAPGVRLLGWQEHLGSLGNNFLAAAAGHPALARALALAAAAVNRGDADMPWLATGPGALSRALAQEIAADAATLDGLRLLERGEAAQVAVFHCFAAYKRTARHWLRAASTRSDAA